MEIDQIFEMLSWDNDKETQLRGIEEAKQIKHLSVFLQPIESKLIWENCARVLISKNDKELQLYLVSMFKWLQDMNWPGADYIYDRLKNMPKKGNGCLQFVQPQLFMGNWEYTKAARQPAILILQRS